MHRNALFAALAALAAAPLSAQVAGTASDPLLNPTATGRWTYQQAAGGSEARFSDAAGAAQLTIRCSRATRQVAIVRPAMTAAPSMQLRTSDAVRLLPATFDSAAAQLIANIAVNDRLLDAMAFSRGRFALTVTGGATLVVPAWGEVTRAIEDCRN